MPVWASRHPRQRIAQRRQSRLGRARAGERNPAPAVWAGNVGLPVKIEETTSGRTFAVEMTEAELSGVGVLLGLYASGDAYPAHVRMRGHALTAAAATDLAREIRAVIAGK